MSREYSKLEKWALVADLVSGVAVLITLVFLAIGIRDNTNATQAAVYEDLLENLNQTNAMLVNDGKLAVLYLDRFSMNWDVMDPEDRARLIFLNRINYRNYDAAYFAFRNGSLDSDQWLRFSQAICRQIPSENDSRGYAELWQETEFVLSEEFAANIEAMCANSKASRRNCAL